MIPLAAQLAVLNGSNRDFQDLMAVAAKCQRAFDEKDFMERIRLDCEFHAALSLHQRKPGTDLHSAETFHALPSYADPGIQREGQLLL